MLTLTSVTCKLATRRVSSIKAIFFPFIFFSYHSFSLSYLELQIIFPCPDIGPATASLDPRPRHWTRDRDFGPATATLDPRPRLWTLDRAAPGATRTPLSCSPNFPRAQYLDIRTLTHELIVKFTFFQKDAGSFKNKQQNED